MTRLLSALRVGVAVGAAITLAASVLEAQSAYMHSGGQGHGAGRVFDRDYYRRPYPELIRALPGGFASLVVDEQEPNDGFMTAPLIALGDTVTGFIAVAGDVDYFAVDVPADARLDLRVTAFTIGSALDARVDLYDTDGVTLLDFSEDVIGRDPRLVYEVTATGRYFVRVTDQAGTGSGNHGYQLRMGIIEKGPGDPTMLWTTGLGGPLGIAAGPAGALYVVDNPNVRVLRVDGSTGVPTPLASLVSTGLGSNVDVVRDVTVDAFGDILAVGKRDIFQPLVWRIDASGGVTDFWVPDNLSAEFTAIAVGPDGDVWLGDQALRNMVRLSPYGDPKRVEVAAIPITNAVGDVYDLAFSPAGQLHWSNSFGEIYKLDGAGMVVQVIQTEPFIEGLAFDQDGYLYAGNGGIGKVLLFDPAGAVVADPFAGTNLAGPLNLVFGRTPDGATTSRLFAVNFGVGLPPPFAGGIVEMNPAAVRAPGWPVADFLHVVGTASSGEYGMAYNTTLSVSGGGAATWTVVDGMLPFELDLDPSTGVISGLPQELGEFTVSFRADAGGRFGFKRLTIRIDPLGVSPTRLADYLLGELVAFTPAQAAAVDLVGNRNGEIDIGDLRAQMRALGELPGHGPLARTHGRRP